MWLETAATAQFLRIDASHSCHSTIPAISPVGQCEIKRFLGFTSKHAKMDAVNQVSVALGRRADLEARLRMYIEKAQVARKREQRRELPSEMSMELLEDLALLEDDELEELIANTVDEVTLQVAVDSGSCANVAHPDDMPKGAVIEPNTDDKHFSGAGGDRIKKFGTCKTKCVGSAGEFTTDWSCAEVTRALHSVSKIAGPEDHPTGYQDVIFNNRRWCVVPPGIVDVIMSKVKAVAEYEVWWSVSG